MSEKKIEAVNGHTLQKVFLSVEDHIAVMTLHNPPVNAADGVVQEEILLLCDYINHEDDIWVCVGICARRAVVHGYGKSEL